MIPRAPIHARHLNDCSGSMPPPSGQRKELLLCLFSCVFDTYIRFPEDINANNHFSILTFHFNLTHTKVVRLLTFWLRQNLVTQSLEFSSQFSVLLFVRAPGQDRWQIKAWFSFHSGRPRLRQSQRRGRKAGRFTRQWQQNQVKYRQSAKNTKPWNNLPVRHTNTIRQWALQSPGFKCWCWLVGVAQVVRSGETQEAGRQLQTGGCWRRGWCWSGGVAQVKRWGVGKHTGNKPAARTVVVEFSTL